MLPTNNLEDGGFSSLLKSGACAVTSLPVKIIHILLMYQIVKVDLYMICVCACVMCGCVCMHACMCVYVRVHVRMCYVFVCMHACM